MDAFSTHLDQWMHALGGPLESLVRLLLAAIAAGAIGLEREIRGRQAGLRTHMLVAIGSALAMIVSSQVAYHDWSGVEEQLRIDPARIAYGVMAGVGFLGAGAIMRKDDAVRGLTTAAAIWCVAALGLSAGLGLYLITILATLLILIVLTVLASFEHFIPQSKFRRLTVRMPNLPASIADARSAARRHSKGAPHLNWQESEEPDKIDITLRVTYWKPDDLVRIESALTSLNSARLVASMESE